MTSERLNLDLTLTSQTGASPLPSHATTPVYQTNLVPFSDTFLHNSKSNARINFTLHFRPAGTQQLDHEIESYNPTTGAITMWVRIPLLPHTCDTTIFLLYGNPAIVTSQEHKTTVWDSNFSAVYHFGNGTSPSTADSTANGNTCVNHGVSPVSSSLGGAASFDGVAGYLDCGNNPSRQITGQAVTLSMWANEMGQSSLLVGKMDANKANGYEMLNVGSVFGDAFSTYVTNSSANLHSADELSSISSGGANQYTAIFQTGSARTFAYDSDDQLKSMNGTAVTIVYDGDSDRVAKTVGGVTTHYLVDDLNPTGYVQVVEEATNGMVTRRYTYGLRRISQEQLTNGSWVLSFYGYDGFDSVRALSGASGVITDSYDYDSWGNAINFTGSTPNVYLYRGEEYDPDLNLYYLRARYLNPLTGRFMTRDPDEGMLAEPMTRQKYIYAGDDPINQIDPTGWQSQSSGGFCGMPLTPLGGGYGVMPIGPLMFPQIALIPLPSAPWSKCGCCDPTDGRVLREMACLFKSANWGWDATERASWMMKGTCGLQRWPWSAQNAKETWRGPIPQDACAIVHTHPKKSAGGSSMEPKPSSGDQDTANRLGKCNYVVSRDGIFVAIPNSQPERVAPATWWEPYKKADCGDGKKPKAPEKPKKPKAPRPLK